MIRLYGVKKASKYLGSAGNPIDLPSERILFMTPQEASLFAKQFNADCIVTLEIAEVAFKAPEEPKEIVPPRVAP